MTPGSVRACAHLVEATKQAFKVRDREIGDPGPCAAPGRFLDPKPGSDRAAAAIDPSAGAALVAHGAPGDTVWMGAVDRSGLAVSYIQSIYWEFGSGVVLPETGILWQNRGANFSLDPARSGHWRRVGARSTR